MPDPIGPDFGDIPSNLTGATGQVLRVNLTNDGFEFVTPGDISGLVGPTGSTGALGPTGATGAPTSIGTIDSQTKSANGAVISSSNLYLQNADSTYPGLVSAGTQTIAGTKTFSNNMYLGANLLFNVSCNIYQNTDDTKRIGVSGGSDASAATGGTIRVYGNDYSGQEGRIIISSGASSTKGEIVFQTGNPTATHWYMSQNGSFWPATNAAKNIGASGYDVNNLYVQNIITSETGSYLALSAGNHTTGAAGAVNISAGDASGAAGTGGSCYLNGGTATTGSGGSIYLSAGDTSSTGDGGDIYLSAGACGTSTKHGVIYFQTPATSFVMHGVAAAATGNFWYFRPTINAGASYGACIGSSSYKCYTGYFNVHPAFTGVHIYAINDGQTLETGDAVKLVNKKLSKCTTSNDPACIGIVSTFRLSPSVNDPNPTDSFQQVYPYDPEGPNITLYGIAALGDSQTGSGSGAKICNEGGSVDDGDLLCTADKDGYLKKQSDDIVHSYTVAQSRESVIFDENGEATECYVYILK